MKGHSVIYSPSCHSKESFTSSVEQKKEDIFQNVGNQTDSGPIDFNSNFFVYIMETNGTPNCLVAHTHQDIFCVLQKKERHAGLELHVGK